MILKGLKAQQGVRPVRLGISAREGIVMSAYTKKYTKGDTIKKFFA